MRTIASVCCCLFFVGALAPRSALAQTPSGWKAHDWNRPRPRVVTPAPQPLPIPPPSDAIVLFDGEDLRHWRDEEGEPAKWIVRDGYMESVPDSGYVYTSRAFGDVQLHVEWAAPTPPSGTSQGRGNSGVFLMGLYEIQVLDSFENVTYADGQAGSAYGQNPPLVNASLPPGEWQSYDIIFRRPRFRPDGELTSPARATVLHNGVLIQDAFEFWGPTSWLQHKPYAAQPDKGPLGLQDHGNPVRYRNIWLRELRETPRPGPEPSEAPETPVIPVPQLAKLAGSYVSPGGEVTEILLDDGRLWALFDQDRRVELCPRGDTRFEFRYTDAAFDLDVDADGNAEGYRFTIGGETRTAKRMGAP